MMSNDSSQLQIDVTQSMCLTAQRSIASQQEDLEKILPTANTLSPVGIKAFEKASHECILFPILRATMIGHGASSKVFQSVRLTDLKLCAEKVLVVGDSHKRHQMVREIELLKSLCSQYTDGSSSGRVGVGGGDTASSSAVSSSQIVQLYGILPNPTDGTLSILLEYMDMGSLQHLVTGGGCADESILSSLAFQITKALEFLHKRRLVHRDIKPSNILLSSSGKVKLSDFGIAKSMEVGTSLAESFVGTFEYMSPERLSGEPYSFVSDIWSLGMSIHSVAIGRYPFSTKGDFWEILQATQKASQFLPPSSKFSETFIGFIASTTDLQSKNRPNAESLLLHPFVQSASPTLNRSQIEELRTILHHSKQWRQAQTNVGRISIDHNIQADFIALLVGKWKDMIYALYCSDDLEEILPNTEAFREITVTKEMLATLSRGLMLNEDRLRRSFRRALQETRAFIGDRLRFMQKNEMNGADNKDSNSSAMSQHKAPAIQQSLSKMEEVKMSLQDRQYMIREQKDDVDGSFDNKSRPQSIPSIQSDCKMSSRLRKSEDCMVNLSCSINKSMRSLMMRRSVSHTKDESVDYADDFVDYDSDEKYSDDDFDPQDEQDHRFENVQPKHNHRYRISDAKCSPQDPDGDEHNVHETYNSDFENDA